MKKNYLLSFFLLLTTAFWHVQAQNAPTGLSGGAVGGTFTKINLTWDDNSLDEGEFEIAFSPVPTGYQTTWTGTSNYSGRGTYQLTNLQANTTYYIWVRAIKNNSPVGPSFAARACDGTVVNIPDIAAPTGKSVSCWSNGIIISTNDYIPAGVTGALVERPYTPRKSILSFDDNSTNESNFIIERRIQGGAYVVIATIPGIDGKGRRSYVDNNTQPNTQYSYRVTAKNGTGVAEPYSETNYFTALPDPPTSPNSLSIYDIGLKKIIIYWNNPANNNVGDFVIERSDDIKKTWFQQGTKTANNPGFVDFTDQDNLIEGKEYFYRVSARNAGGTSAPSNVLSVTTEKLVPPNPSSNMVAKTISTTQIDLNWIRGAEKFILDGVTNKRVSQEIFRSSISGEAAESFIKIATLDNNQSTYSDKTGMPKTKYWYKILSANYQGQSPYSNVASATTLGPPYAPSNLTAVLASDALGNILLKTSWKDNSDDEWGFAIERSLDSTFAKGITSTTVRADLDSNSITATSIPIEQGLTYYFRANASNQYGTSKYSATAKIAVAVTSIPNAPYDLKGTATSAEVSLQWGDDSNNEAAFDVERSLDGTTFAKIGSTGRNQVTYSDKTVSEKTKYYYRVRATNSKGNSIYTNVLVLTTPAKVSASIDIVADEVFQVYPNPTSDLIKVSVSENMLKDSGMIIITDKTNRIISKTILTPNQLDYRLDLSNYSEGTYTISLRTATQQITKRVYKF